MKKTIALLTALFLTPVLTADSHAQVPDRTAVQSAITRLLKKPIEKTSSDMALVIEFAEKSDAVSIDIVQGLAPIGDTPRDHLLLGYFIVGAVQYDLMHPDRANDKVADKVAAIRTSLFLYRTLQKRDKTFQRAELEKLAMLDRKGKLAQHVQAVLSK